MTDLCPFCQAPNATATIFWNYGANGIIADATHAHVMCYACRKEGPDAKRLHVEDREQSLEVLQSDAQRLWTKMATPELA